MKITIQGTRKEIFEYVKLNSAVIEPREADTILRLAEHWTGALVESVRLVMQKSQKFPFISTITVLIND